MPFTPTINPLIRTRKRKGLVKLFSGNAGAGIPAPFYYTTAVVQEGRPMKFGASADLISPCGAGDGSVCVGLALQETYDESTWDPQLRGYHFANDTRQRLDGQPIGLLMGSGYAATLNYKGTVAWGNQAAFDPTDGKLKAAAGADLSAGNGLPIVFEGSGTDAAVPVRIRFNFRVDGVPPVALAEEANNFFAATDMTGAQAETLSDGSNADSLHVHAAAGLTFMKDGSNAVAADALAIPITKRYVAKTTGADAEALTLANGVKGQRLTISLVTDGGGDGTLTPTTCSGFATIVFADAGDTVTLEYVDDTAGWVIVGMAGVAAPPVITLPQ